MARATDPAPSHDTADHFAPATLSRLQGLVLAAVGRRQPVHARDLERDPAFADLGPSTVRKRVTELVRAGLVERHDEVRVGRSTLTRWRLSRRVTQHTQAHTDPHLADTEAA
jgi:DNA-binding MarR family transcriptional regulator